MTECGLLAENVDVSPSRLLIERAKFAPRVMVSAGMCLQGKGRLHFVQEKSKANADYYVNELLPKLMDDCHHFARPIFHISARWSTCACSKNWPNNGLQLTVLFRQGHMASKQHGFKLDYYHVWSWMLDKSNRLNPQPQNIPELKTALLMQLTELN